MAITRVLRASMFQARVLNMEESVKFYRDVLGLIEVGKTDDGRVCFKAYDEFDHHTFTIREADTPGLDFMAFKVDCDSTLDALEKETKEFGLECEWIAANSDQPGYGRRLAVYLPTGHRIDLFNKVERAEQHPGLLNPEVWPVGVPPVGCGTVAIDHALLFGPNSKESVRYFKEVLGFATTEIAKAPDGENDLCTWLTCATRPHDVAVLEHAEPGKIHHFGFKLDSWNDLGRAADILTINRAQIDAGPMRHGITRGYTIYFFDPSGNRLEFFAGGYAHYPDHPVRIWEFEELPRGIYYYSREIKDTYLTVVT